jgi:hypothetical protein
MSLRFEQYNSLKMTREFLSELIQSKRPKTAMEWHEWCWRAASCLHHYPFLKEDGEPMFSNDDFKT